jgi:CPA1 family monovalent cation:H+ antiporter
VVLFTLLLGLATRGHAPEQGEVALMLVREAGGGLVFGAALGAAMFALLRSIDNYKVEVMITLAGVLGGYELARQLHISGPLAMVVAGLIMGNHGRSLAMSDTTRHHVDLFWELLDDILNALLFVLLGLEIVMVSFAAGMVAAAGATIVLALLARWFAVGLPMLAFGKWFRLPAGSWRVLTWGGLRGGISVALALSLPPGPAREIVLTLTYAVVLFSIIVQGLSIRAVALRTFKAA